MAQLVDRTKAPNASGSGIAKSLADEIGAGRGDWTTSGSSSFIIARDPFRAIRRGRHLLQEIRQHLHVIRIDLCFLRDQVRNRQDAKIHGLESRGGAEEPAGEGCGEEKHVEENVHHLGEAPLPRLHRRRQRGRPVRETPQQPRRGDEEDRDARPLVPREIAQLLR